MKENTKEQQHIFTNQMLRSLLIPVIFEQVLNSLMGTVDTMMVSNVGSAAISAVSLVDSINVLVIQAFSALAAGGAIICSQYRTEKSRNGKQIRQTGTIHHHSHICSGNYTMPDIPNTSFTIHIRKSRSRRYDSIQNILLLYSAILPVYCAL